MLKGWKLNAAHAWVALAALILAVGVIAPVVTAFAASQDSINHGLLATGQLKLLQAAGSGHFKVIGGCSGTVVDPSGLILTNYHCVGLAKGMTDDTGQGLKEGDLYNPDGLGVWAPTVDP